MKIRYKIYAQEFCRELNETILIIEQIGKREKIRKTAAELITSKDLLAGFSSVDALLIEFIAEMERK